MSVSNLVVLRYLLLSRFGSPPPGYLFFQREYSRLDTAIVRFVDRMWCVEPNALKMTFVISLSAFVSFSSDQDAHWIRKSITKLIKYSSNLFFFFFLLKFLFHSVFFSVFIFLCFFFSIFVSIFLPSPFFFIFSSLFSSSLFLMFCPSFLYCFYSFFSFSFIISFFFLLNVHLFFFYSSYS